MIKKLLCVLFFLPGLVFAAEFTQGKDYQLVVNSHITHSKTPSITEFFSYGCPSCYKIDASMTVLAKKLGKSVQFERVPVVFRPPWDLYAKAYYTAKILSLVDKMNPVIFKAIQDDKNTLDSKQAMIALFVSQGVDKEIAKNAFENSPTIDLHVNQGMDMMAKYQITSVPSFIVNNKYKTDLQTAGSPERLIQLLDYLVRQPG